MCLVIVYWQCTPKKLISLMVEYLDLLFIFHPHVSWSSSHLLFSFLLAVATFIQIVSESPDSNPATDLEPSLPLSDNGQCKIRPQTVRAPMIMTPAVLPIIVAPLSITPLSTH